MRIKATIVAYAFSVQCFKNATIEAYAGIRVKEVYRVETFRKKSFVSRNWKLSTHTSQHKYRMARSKCSWDNIFVNFGNALHITKILASKILLLYKCSPASYINISRQYWRAPHRHQMENFPVAASSICNTHDSVNIPSDPVYIRKSLPYNANRSWWKTFAAAWSYCYSRENFRDCTAVWNTLQ